MYILYIRKYRRLRKLSQEQLSFLSGISSSYISRLEIDNTFRERSPKLTILENLAFSLEICPNSILHYSCTGCFNKSDCKRPERWEEDDSFYEDNLKYYLD